MTGGDPAGARDVVVLGAVPFHSGLPSADWQLSRALARLGHRTVYLDPPRSVGRRLFSSEPRRPQFDGEPAVDATWVASGSRLDIADRAQQLAISAAVARSVRRHRLRDPIILVMHPVFGSLPGLRLTIVYWQQDRQWADDGLPRAAWLRLRHDKLLRRATVVTAVSDQIAADNDLLGVFCHVIPNGVEHEHWSASSLESPLLANVPSPRFVLSGGWGWRVDKDLLYQLAKNHPRFNFVIIGDDGVPTNDIPGNMYFLGRHPYSSLPAVIAHCDVGLIPYVMNEFNAAASPLKLWEYRSSGLPVVTSPVASHDAICLHVARTMQEWSEALGTALGERLHRERIMGEAARESWEARVHELMGAVNQATAGFDGR